MKKFFLCPICKKEKAYYSSTYTDSLVCWHNGKLIEVGTISNKKRDSSLNLSSLPLFSFDTYSVIQVSNLQDLFLIADYFGVPNLKKENVYSRYIPVNDKEKFYILFNETDKTKHMRFTTKENYGTTFMSSLYYMKDGSSNKNNQAEKEIQDRLLEEMKSRTLANRYSVT